MSRGILCFAGELLMYPWWQSRSSRRYTLSVGVLEHLPYQVVLGCEVPTLVELIARRSCEARASCTSDSLLVVTRSKSNQEQASSTGGWEVLPFANEEKLKEWKSKRQRWRVKLRGAKRAQRVAEPADSDIFTIPGEIAKLQREDSTLSTLFSKCVPESTQVTDKGKEVFVVKGDKLYRCSQMSDQLVLPQRLRATTLNLSHSIPWSRHLGQAKTFSRMVPHFYRPQQYFDTVRYCQCCPHCQLTAPGRTDVCVWEDYVNVRCVMKGRLII